MNDDKNSATNIILKEEAQLIKATENKLIFVWQFNVWAVLVSSTWRFLTNLSNWTFDWDNIEFLFSSLKLFNYILFI